MGRCMIQLRQSPACQMIALGPAAFIIAPLAAATLAHRINVLRAISVKNAARRPAMWKPALSFRPRESGRKSTLATMQRNKLTHLRKDDTRNFRQNREVMSLGQ